MSDIKRRIKAVPVIPTQTKKYGKNKQKRLPS
jgi:hypothetical protein